MIISNVRVLTFDAGNHVYDSASVEIRRDGTIGRVGTAVSAAGDDVVDGGGRLLMPALINCHTHLYGTLARGIQIPGEPPRNFPEILSKLWWRLDRTLNEDDIYYSALIGLIDSAKSGVGTLIDHHSSPRVCAGSLDRIEQAFREVGLRGALCYEVSDRNGNSSACEGILENFRFIQKPHDDMVGASFGLHASFTLSDRTLAQCLEANQSAGAGFHLHIGEDVCDRAAVRRLDKLGLLNSRTMAAHCLHISAGDMGILARSKVNVIHNPESNCNNAVGIAKLIELMAAGAMVGLGSDGCSPRMWDEFKTAFHVQKLRRHDPRVGYSEAYAAAFLNNREIVRKAYDFDVGRIATGAKADFILVDYFPPTSLHTGNLFGHLLFGIANAPVDSLLVNGRFVVKDKRCVTVDERMIAERAALQSQSLWRRFENSCYQ
jgi:putative selenium metabolism protein SsnA